MPSVGDLRELGVTTIDGIDLSPEMLAVAAGTGAYRNLTVADLNQLPISPDAGVCRFRQRRYVHQRSRRPGGRAEPAATCSVTSGIVAWVIGVAVWPEFEPVLAAARSRCSTSRSSRYGVTGHQRL